MCSTKSQQQLATSQREEFLNRPDLSPGFGKLEVLHQLCMPCGWEPELVQTSMPTVPDKGACSKGTLMLQAHASWGHSALPQHNRDIERLVVVLFKPGHMRFESHNLGPQRFVFPQQLEDTVTLGITIDCCLVLNLLGTLRET